MSEEKRPKPTLEEIFDRIKLSRAFIEDMIKDPKYAEAYERAQKNVEEYGDKIMSEIGDDRTDGHIPLKWIRRYHGPMAVFALISEYQPDQHLREGNYDAALRFVYKEDMERAERIAKLPFDSE